MKQTKLNIQHTHTHTITGTWQIFIEIQKNWESAKTVAFCLKEPKHTNARTHCSSACLLDQYTGRQRERSGKQQCHIAPIICGFECVGVGLSF